MAMAECKRGKLLQSSLHKAYSQVLMMGCRSKLVTRQPALFLPPDSVLGCHGTSSADGDKDAI